MRKSLRIETENISLFKEKLIHFGNSQELFAILDSHQYAKNNTQYTYYKYDFVAAWGKTNELTESKKHNFENLSEFVNENMDWIFGYLGYDLKNEIENLSSANIDELNFPNIYFFIPEFVITSENEIIMIHYKNDKHTEDYVNDIINQIESFKIPNEKKNRNRIELLQRFPEKEYIETVNEIKKHIQRGDIYEMNFCQEFYSFSEINPLDTYIRLRELSPAPFACFYKNKDKFLMSTSPERFLKKTGNTIISQPIKGTIKRGINALEDEKLKEKLLNDPKERAENVMIVDLVRNDLSRTAKKQSVRVEELYGIYSFKNVHQMISTIKSEIEKETDIIEVLENAFPMGSMTGAPKIRAMEIIEEFEKTKRGLYSGAFGYFSPDKDFDFNVVIRSLLYNETKKYVSFTVGGAITSLANAKDEYNECLVKATALINVLN